MEKNTLLAVVLSTAFLIAWWAFVQPPKKAAVPAVAATQTQAPHAELQTPSPAPVTAQEVKMLPEKEVIVESPNYQAVFTTRGAAIKHWFIKENNGGTVDLVMNENRPLSTYDTINYDIVKNDARTLVFAAASPEGFTITKTYALSEEYIHTLTIATTRSKAAAVSQAPLVLTLGPGIGTDAKEAEENLKLTQITTYGKNAKQKDAKMILKTGEYPARDYQWASLDNRYFMSALIPQKSVDFDTVSVQQDGKKAPFSVSLVKNAPFTEAASSYRLSFYMGPKSYYILKHLGLKLEEAVDFSWISPLGKVALSTLTYLYKITHNYGWSIVLLTVFLQIIVFPLTIKSFKAQAAMKRLQPIIKQLQEKYKEDPKRLNMEMLNVYKTQKVNPLGGCLPMILQIPIFWALFTTLRNSYELRGAPWIFWIKDLSNYDPYFILPILMGLGMLVQQKLVSVSADPMQARMMYLMPVVFTFIFLKFPAGLVLYWFTNSILSISEQYVIMRREEKAA